MCFNLRSMQRAVGDGPMWNSGWNGKHWRDTKTGRNMDSWDLFFVMKKDQTTNIYLK